MEIKPTLRPSPLNNSDKHKDRRIILFRGSKLEDLHTRKTRQTLCWVYKPSDFSQVNWNSAFHEVEHSSSKTDCSGCLTTAKSFSQDPCSLNLKSTVCHQGCQSSFQHHSLEQMGRRTGPWCLNPHRVSHDTIQANGPCISSIKSCSRTFPGLPARPGFCHSVTTINQTPQTTCSKQSSIDYYPSKTTQHENPIQHKKQHT